VSGGNSSSEKVRGKENKGIFPAAVDFTTDSSFYGTVDTRR